MIAQKAREEAGVKTKPSPTNPPTHQSKLPNQTTQPNHTTKPPNQTTQPEETNQGNPGKVNQPNRPSKQSDEFSFQSTLTQPNHPPE